MGGTSLLRFGVETKRVTTDELFKLHYHVTSVLKTSPQYIKSNIVKFYHQKPNHGDEDICCLFKPNTNYKQLITELFNPKAIDNNHIVISCEVWDVQVDFICFSNEQKFHQGLDFRNYSPFGNIFSRLIKQFGLKWGVAGLEYPVKLSDSEQLGEIFITDNLNRIIEFAGLDSRVYNKGFEKQSDIFDYVSSSPYFNREIYLFENLNHTNRKRDAVRPDYNAWMKYIEFRESKFKREKDKRVYIPEIEQFFKINLQEQIDGKLVKHEEFKRQREKFNGSFLIDWVGLQGKELGKVLGQYKNEFGEFIQSESAAEIKEHFLNWYKSLDKNKEKV